MTTLVEKAEALAVEVSCSKDTLSVTLSDGRSVSAPLAWFPRLADAASAKRADWELIGAGLESTGKRSTKIFLSPVYSSLRTS
jgi:hypothetical protein